VAKHLGTLAKVAVQRSPKELHLGILQTLFPFIVRYMEDKEGFNSAFRENAGSSD
jgi:hypothetical protein